MRSTSASRGGSRSRGTEIRDGAHNPDGARYLVERLPTAPTSPSSRRSSPTRTSTRCCAPAEAGARLVATSPLRPEPFRARPRRACEGALRTRWRRSTTPSPRSRARTQLGEPRARDRLALPPRRPRAGGAASGWPKPNGAARRPRVRGRSSSPRSSVGAFALGYLSRQAIAMSVSPSLAVFSPTTDPNSTRIGLVVVIVLWLATALWTFKDARRRVEGPWLVGSRDAPRLLPALPRADHLPVRASARVPAGRARAPPRDPGHGGAARADRPALPGLSGEGG